MTNVSKASYLSLKFRADQIQSDEKGTKEKQIFEHLNKFTFLIIANSFRIETFDWMNSERVALIEFDYIRIWMSASHRGSPVARLIKPLKKLLSIKSRFRWKRNFRPFERGLLEAAFQRAPMNWLRSPLCVKKFHWKWLRSLSAIEKTASSITKAYRQRKHFSKVNQIHWILSMQLGQKSA